MPRPGTTKPASPGGNFPAFENDTFSCRARTCPAKTPAEVLDVGFVALASSTPGGPPCGRKAWIAAALVNVNVLPPKQAVLPIITGGLREAKLATKNAPGLLP